MVISILAYSVINNKIAIGYGNGLPWESKTEISHLKKMIEKLTSQGNFAKIIVGKNTFNFLPLYWKKNYKNSFEVIETAQDYERIKTEISSNLDKIFIIFGGKTIYESFADVCDWWMISKINNKCLKKDMDFQQLVYLKNFNFYLKNHFKVISKPENEYDFEVWKKAK
ncbi:dihydrofolate reductase [Mycoplasma buteonis]|uniref:dihydrofolate reductase n=1 Tax=Mycoplasma buteonis TaxID=171280 RepID=UPI00055F39CE|nr:dihydrofolate reductase [Mycoplasma buteonis]